MDISDFRPSKEERRQEGRVLRDQAIKQVASHSPVDADVLFDVGVGVAKENFYFTSDDIWDAYGATVRVPRVMGPVMKRLQREGVAVPTDRYRQAHRGVNHARPQRLWKTVL